MVRLQRAQYPFEVLLVDYLQLFPAVADPGVSEATVLGNISSQLKRLAYDEQILVIAISSRNRVAAFKQSDLARLRGSGQLEFDADWVLTMSADAGRQERESDAVVLRKIVMSKARHGQGGAVQLLAFDRPHQRLTPIGTVEGLEHV